MLSIQPRGLDNGDEELRAVGVRAGISHGQPASSIVLYVKVLILESELCS